MVELMYRGTLWLQHNGSDWRATTFLNSPRALGLNIAGDGSTLEALPSSDPLLGGYISKDNLETIKGTSGIIVTGKGRGRVITFTFNPTFRAYWWGTQKLLANAIFFGRTINGNAAE